MESFAAGLHFHGYPHEFLGSQALLDVWRQMSHKIRMSFVMSQVIVRGVEFIDANERYFAAAVGEDLAAMLREIDRHPEQGVIMIEKLLRREPGGGWGGGGSGP